MTDARRDLGRRGEELAARYLESRGYRVVRRNYRCRLGEIDLVVEQAGVLVFVEVRTKMQRSLVLPEETITWRKARRLVGLAEHYLAATGQEDRPWRVDVVAIEVGASGTPVRIEQFQDATSGVVTP